MNHKAVGTKGQNCVIGELAKWNIDVAYPLSDNLPFDLVIIRNNKLFRAQIKTSEKQKTKGSIRFNLRTTNWYSGTMKTYTKDDCDIFLCYDIPSNALYLLSPFDFSDRINFTIRIEESKNKQKKMINHHKDFIITEKRLNNILN